MGWLQDLWNKLTGQERPAPVEVKPEARAVQQEMAREVLEPAPLPEPVSAGEGETETVNDAPVVHAKLTKSGKPRKERKDKGVKRGPRKPKS